MPIDDKKKPRDQRTSSDAPKTELKTIIDTLEKIKSGVAPSAKSTRTTIPQSWSKLSYNQKLTAYKKMAELKLDLKQALFLECIGLQTIIVQEQLEKNMLIRLRSNDASLGQKEVTRLIAIHPDSIKDAEVEDAIYLQLLNHKPENCLIRTSIEGILDVFESYPTLKTVVPIGHGFTPQRQVKFYCGPVDGFHDDVAKQWSNLLTHAPQVQHLRLVSCYYGSTNPSFNDALHGQIKYKIDKKHQLDKGTMTALVTYSPYEPLPFKENSMAGLIWNYVVVEGKRANFCLSATSLILNPLPPKKPQFFAATDHDHYTGGDGIAKPMWQDTKLRKIDKTKSITLATEDSFKLKDDYTVDETSKDTEETPPIHAMYL